MANTTQLKQTDGAIQVKAGDFGSRFAFQLLDEHGNLMEELNGQTASVKLADSEGIAYEKDALVENGEVAFKFDQVLPSGKYWLEIWVDGYIFPSDREMKIRVIKASKEREVSAPTSPKLPPVRDLLGNPVDKITIYRTNGEVPGYPGARIIVINEDNDIESYAISTGFEIVKLNDHHAQVLIIQNNTLPDSAVRELTFNVNGEPYTLTMEYLVLPSEAPIILDAQEGMLNADNGFAAEILIHGLPDNASLVQNDSYRHHSFSPEIVTDEAGSKLVLKHRSPPTKPFDGEYVVEIIHDQYTKKIPIRLTVEV